MWVFVLWLAFGTVTLLGFLAGLARARFLPVPVIASAVIVVSYAVLLTSVWAWASRCWHCSTDHDDDRRLVFLLAITFPGFLAVIDVVAIWVGAWVSTIIWEQQPPVSGRAVALGCVTFALTVAFLVLSFSG